MRKMVIDGDALFREVEKLDFAIRALGHDPLKSITGNPLSENFVNATFLAATRNAIFTIGNCLVDVE